MKFETERLILRPISLEDRNEVFEYRSDSEANKYQGWIPETPEDVDRFIDKLAKEANEPETWFQLVIIEKKSQKIVGDLGIHFMDTENRQAGLGYTIHTDFQKKGYATESVKAVIDYLFSTLNKHRITASVDPENTASIRLLERIGFRKEAHFVESLLLNGVWVDDIIYALLEKDWEKLNSQ